VVTGFGGAGLPGLHLELPGIDRASAREVPGRIFLFSAATLEVQSLGCTDASI